MMLFEENENEDVMIIESQYECIAKIDENNWLKYQYSEDFRCISIWDFKVDTNNELHKLLDVILALLNEHGGFKMFVGGLDEDTHHWFGSFGFFTKTEMLGIYDMEFDLSEFENERGETMGEYTYVNAWEISSKNQSVVYPHREYQEYQYRMAAQCVPIVKHLMEVGDWNEEAQRVFADTYQAYYAHPIRVLKCKDMDGYMLCDDGNHRLDAAKKEKVAIPVVISGMEY